MAKLSGKRLKYRTRPALVEVLYDLKDPKLQNAMSFCWKAFHLDALLGSSAFRLLRVDWLEYFMIFRFDGMYFTVEIRQANEAHFIR